MAIAFDNAADAGNNGGGGTLTFSYTMGSGSGGLLVALIQGDLTTDDISSVTYNGVNMTFGAKIAGDGASYRWIYCYYLPGPATGSNSLSVSSTSSHYLLAGLSSYTGVNATGQPDGSNTHDSGANQVITLTTSETITTDQSWQVLCAGNSSASGAHQTAGAGATIRTFDATFGIWTMFDSNGGLSPGSQSMTTNISSGVSIQHIILSFAPTGGGFDATTVVGPNALMNAGGFIGKVNV